LFSHIRADLQSEGAAGHCAGCQWEGPSSSAPWAGAWWQEIPICLGMTKMPSSGWSPTTSSPPHSRGAHSATQTEAGLRFRWTWTPNQWASFVGFPQITVQQFSRICNDSCFFVVKGEQNLKTYAKVGTSTTQKGWIACGGYVTLWLLVSSAHMEFIYCQWRCPAGTDIIGLVVTQSS